MMQKSLSRGIVTEGFREDIELLGVNIDIFTLEDADCAAKLWSITRKLGLSLGDRACLSYAIRKQVPANS